MNFKIFFIFLITTPSVYNSSIEEVKMGLKEVAYNYYMRGKYIQYNVNRRSVFSPEEANKQNFNYICCSVFARNIYFELLNITIPTPTENLIIYAKNYVGSPEVIAYSNITGDSIPQMAIYAPNENKNYKIIKNFSIKDIMNLVEIGDIIVYTGHTQFIYDFEKDSNGKIIDVIILESSIGKGRSYVNVKFAPNFNIDGITTSYHLSYLYLNKKLNTIFKEGLEEGSITMNKLSKTTWININNTNTRKEEYAILRFVKSDSKGNAVLKYKTIYPQRPNQFKNDDIIKLSSKNVDRIKKYKHLYIEKMCNMNYNNTVELGDFLIYTIIIKNMDTNNYKDDLKIIENLSEFVTYEMHYENKEIKSFNYDIKNKRLIWNIGKLSVNETINITYIVKVTSGKPKDIIESTGLVGNIPSSIIKNTININLNKKQKKLIEKNFEKLKTKYDGKKLINEIYKHSFNIDIKFDKFEVTNLIFNNNLESSSLKSFGLNKNNSFYGAILNKYWSTIRVNNQTYIKGIPDVKVYILKDFGDFKNDERRADFIYKETFKTGDILIYKNNNDKTYTVDKDNNKLLPNYITYEEGEYAYIYIENKGFVGVNLGDDKEKNTKDDRNEFNAKYYKDNNLTLYKYYENPSDELLEIANIQTLFGKD